MDFARTRHQEARTMLTISREALSVIQRISTHPATSDMAGLRIAHAESSSSLLGVEMVQQPSPGDSRVDRDGAHLYLCPDAVRRLDGHMLDARTQDDGKVMFVLRDAS
jgi:Fe-S cluster assembly iron-binding protein IscA